MTDDNMFMPGAFMWSLKADTESTLGKLEPADSYPALE